jgi:nucleotide-binding universal stress UspA family protein
MLLAAGRRLVEETIADLSGVAAEPQVVIGEPARALADAAEFADLLVLGSRRWGPISRLALGSTSEAVVRRATGPVLVLPRAADAPAVNVAAPMALTAT